MAVRDSSTLPLILSTSKYFRYVFQLSASFYQRPNIPDTFFGDKMHNSSLELGRKRVELKVCESFKYFSQELLHKYLKKDICYFKSPISPRRGPQWKSLFWAFFLNSQRNPTTQKISFHWGPLHAFSNVWRNICKFCFQNICCNVSVKNLGHNLATDYLILTNRPFFIEK